MSERIAAENNLNTATVQAHEQCDVIIVCALLNPELESVLKTGTNPWNQRAIAYDPSLYHTTEFTTKEGSSMHVVAAAASHMGMAASTALATKMILKFRPRLVVMVGIAAGAKPADQGYGDILAADKTFDYGSGKIKKTEDIKVIFQPDPEPITIQSQLQVKLNYWRNKTAELNAIRTKWIDANPTLGLPDTPLRLHLGPIGSGAAVIDNIDSVEGVQDHWRKLIGIEMEAYGVHRACEDSNAPPPAYLCFKSICDFAESKIDRWQSYAAFTAAQFCYSFLESEWDSLRLPSVVPSTTSPVAASPDTHLRVLEFVTSRFASVISHKSGTGKSILRQNIQKELKYGSEVAILTYSGFTTLPFNVCVSLST